MDFIWKNNPSDVFRKYGRWPSSDELDVAIELAINQAKRTFLDTETKYWYMIIIYGKQKF